MSTIEDQIECVQREIKMREEVYPRFILQGKMSKDFAYKQIATMKAVLVTLHDVAGKGRLL